jgi:hypothetical protein
MAVDDPGRVGARRITDCRGCEVGQ